MRKLVSVCLLVAVIGMALMMNSCGKPQKAIGIQMYTLRQQLDSNLVGTIEKIGKAGYVYLEAASYRNGKIYGMDPAEFKALVEKNGMTLLSTHVGSHLPDSAHWADQMAWWDTCISAHVTAGVKYIVQPSIEDTAYKSADYLKRYCAYFNAVGEKCNAAGVKFGYHNHDREFSTLLDGQRVYDIMLNNTDPSKLFFELDLWWIYVGGGNAVEYFQKYPGRFSLFHVKDEKEIGASGKIDFKSIFENAKLAGAQYYIVEQEEFSTDPFTSIKQSMDYLQKAEFVK
jgi:sugar phosphate isomerase/epimerase